MDFHSQFKFLLDNSNVSQIKIAEVIGISPQAVSKWYTGKSEPDTNTLKLIADYFHVSTDFLLGHYEQLSDYEQELKEIQILKQLLIRSGYMNNDEDLTEKELDNLIKMAKNNREFLRK